MFSALAIAQTALGDSQLGPGMFCYGLSTLAVLVLMDCLPIELVSPSAEIWTTLV
jgi:hypothetical protein